LPAAPLPFEMTKRASTKTEKGDARPLTGAVYPVESTQSAISETSSAPAERPGAVALMPLGARRGVRSRPQKPTAKELSALAKKAARVRWAERMDSEGR
jgi:hypothetical protein